MPDPTPTPPPSWSPRVQRLPLDRGVYRIEDLNDRNAEDIYALGVEAARAKADWLLTTQADDCDCEGEHHLARDLYALSMRAEDMPEGGATLAVYVQGSRGPAPVGVRVTPVGTTDLGVADMLAVPAVGLGIGGEDDLLVFPRHEVADLLAYGDVMSIGDALTMRARLAR